MQVCSPNMTKSTGAVCQLKQLPCHSVSLHRLQGSGHHTHLTRQTCGNHTAPTVGSSLAVDVKHGANGAIVGRSGSLDCSASRLGAASSSPGKVLVTGGGGYFGFRLGRVLASQGMSVILLDMHKLPWDVPEGATFYQSDIRDFASLYKVCEGVDCIFHTASYGMSGPEQLRKEQVESINVGGTNNVIKVCKERGIPRLVYTSTINVVFAGKPIQDGDENSVPHVPLDKHIDHYSRTKAIAELSVLSANGFSLKGGGLLRTCVLRPCGIYGPEERRHLHRVMVNVERRFFSFRFGDPQAQMNWVHVDNLVMAHTLAAEALTPKRNCIASGQAYFINDGQSVNLFEWLTPLFEKLGYRQPLINLPFSLVYSAAILVEYLHLFLRPVIEVPLLFTRNEVRNIAVSHTFKIDKARRQLGYCPKAYTLTDSVDQYLRSRLPHSTVPLLKLPWAPQLPRHLILLPLLMCLSLVFLIIGIHIN
ncbi:putative short-chain dehydrogenase/reductase family 42E member 2 [Thalassophryne amazonica]|uniref:putative short-chain dehydrogenase/reductase family 42E member 2 n=1 Tax=Thalassophryne amazonica TaxID=390379 RepID=UPI0014716BF8|nr:putative short-chain dehydrogenase/reductase family 42E member 2 [Thalassophryne amazonica]XP_034045551.1 putative short-chain dehydrogenase/reductase family 42E member 2 [Thalassophryne amazonica]